MDVKKADAAKHPVREKRGIIWGRTNALTKSQWAELKRSFGLRLKQARPAARLALYAVLNDGYEKDGKKEPFHYSEQEEDRFFFALCADAFVNRRSEKDGDDSRGAAKDGGGNGTGEQTAKRNGLRLEWFLSRVYNSDDAGSDSLRRDILAMCGERYALNGRLQKHMAKYMYMMKAKKLKLDVQGLEYDLVHWQDADEKVQVRWGRAISRPADDNSNDNSNHDRKGE